jgi:glucose-6-phosphate 1-dehydrogenase
MLNKEPGIINEDIKLHQTKLDLSFNNSRIFGAYERLLLEAMRGNSALFISRDESEQAWIWVDSIQNAWNTLNDAPKHYSAGGLTHLSL